MLETSGSHRVLEELENAQLFTFTDDGGMYFRYHEVLQSHLEMALVEEYGPAEARSWYLRSASVLESLCELRSAARAYAKAGDWVSVSRLVQDAGGARIDATVVDDAHLLPASTWQHDPWLALANARRLVREGALKRAAEAYQHARTLYEEPNYQQMCRYEVKSSRCGCPDIDGVDEFVRLAGPTLEHGPPRRFRESPDFGAIPVPTSARMRGCVSGMRGGGHRGRDRFRPPGIGVDPEGRIGRLVDNDYRQPGNGSAGLIGSSDEDAAPDLSTIASLAEKEGLPWISRLCQGLEQITLITSQDATWRFECCSEMIRADDLMGDRGARDC